MVSTFIERQLRYKSKNPFTDDIVNGIENIIRFVFSPVWIETFIMTFLGEWGDRSQFASIVFFNGLAIALAGAKDFWPVTIGSLLGHAICTAL